jgi:hypothetical protein
VDPHIAARRVDGCVAATRSSRGQISMKGSRLCLWRRHEMNRCAAVSSLSPMAKRHVLRTVLRTGRRRRRTPAARAAGRDGRSGRGPGDGCDGHDGRAGNSTVLDGAGDFATGRLWGSSRESPGTRRLLRASLSEELQDGGTKRTARGSRTSRPQGLRASGADRPPRSRRSGSPGYLRTPRRTPRSTSHPAKRRARGDRRCAPSR